MTRYVLTCPAKPVHSRIARFRHLHKRACGARRLPSFSAAGIHSLRSVALRSTILPATTVIPCTMAAAAISGSPPTPLGGSNALAREHGEDTLPSRPSSGPSVTSAPAPHL